MKQGEIVVVYRVENAQAMAAISNVQSHIKKTSDAATKSTNRITEVASKMGAGFAGTAAVMKKFGLITVGAMAGGSAAMKGFVDSASDMQSLRASFISLTGSMESAEQVMRTLYDFGKRTAFTNEQIQTTAKSFLAMGVSVKNLPGLMQDLGDIAGATGADLGAMSLQISQAFGKGKLELSDWKILSTYIGGLKPILEGVVKQRTGISNLSDAFEKGAVSAEILREALDKANDKGNFAFEGAIRQSETFKGRMSNLQEQITNTGLKILGVDAVTGQIKADGIFDRLSKKVTRLTDWLSKNEETIIRVATTIQSNALPTLVAFGAAFAAMKLGQFGASMVKSGIALRTFITEVHKGKSKMAAFNLVASANPFAIIAVAIATVVGALVFLQVKFNIFGKAWDAIKAAWGSAIEWFGGIWDGIKKVFADVERWFSGVFGGISSAANSALGSVSKIFSDLWGGIKDTWSSVTGWFSSLWDGVKRVFSGLVGWIKEWGLTVVAVIFFPISFFVGLFFKYKEQIFATFNEIAAFISSVANAIWGAIVAVFTPIIGFFAFVFGAAWQGVLAVWGIVVSVFTTIWDGIVAVFSVAIGFFVDIFTAAWSGIVAVWSVVAEWFGGIWNSIKTVFNNIAGWFGGVFRGAWDAIVGVFGGLANWFRGVWNSVVGIFGSVGVAIGNAIGGTFKSAINSVLRFVTGMINTFIRGINWATDIINHIPGVKIPRIGELNVPQLAEGGIVTSATLAVVGEGSEPEAVIPLSKLTQFLKDMNEGDSDRRDGRGGAPQINQTVQLTNGIEVDEYNASLVRQMRRA